MYASPGEFKGEITHMPEYPQEGVLARRPHPRCEERPVENSRERRPHLQVRGELAKIYLEGCGLKSGTETSFIAESANDRATPGSCSPICSITEGAQLRRLVDRMGQQSRRADRKIRLDVWRVRIALPIKILRNSCWSWEVW